MRPAAFALALVLGSTGAWAQAGFDAGVSLRTDAWSGDRRLTDRGALAAASAWGRARLDLGAAGQIVGDGWVRERSRADGAPRGRVRELYWRGEVGPVTLRVGRQMTVWGRADGLNPTDNLSPRDFTLLTPQDGEQRHGRDAVGASLPLGPGDVALSWSPRAASHTIPLPPLEGVRWHTEPPPKRSQWALKWDAQGDGVDGSVSYLDGDDPWPDLSLVGVSAAGVDVALRNQRARILGADLSVTRDGVVWRAEAAWLHTASEGRTDFRHKKDQLWVVAGGEWTLPDRLVLGLEITAKQVFGFAPATTVVDPFEREIARRELAIAAQTARRQAGIVWRLARRFDDDRWGVEASGVALGPGGNGVVRGVIDWTVSDRVRLVAGVVSTFGPADSAFGQLNRNRLAFVQLRVGLSAAGEFP